jgi:hypothetical protein
VLLNLPEEAQAKLAHWLLNGMPYHEANVLVAKEFGVVLKSLGPFSGFWREVCQPLMLKRRNRALSSAEDRAVESSARPGQFDAATLDALKQKAYELAERPDVNPRDVKAVLMLVLKARDQELEEKKLAFDRQKFEFDAAKACLAKLPELKVISSDKGMSDGQKIEQVRLKLFGVAAE